MEHPFPAPELMLADMRREAFALQKKINRTAKWRCIKRYNLLEKLYKLDEDRGLIAHVYEMEDQWDEWYNIGEGTQTLSCGDCGAVLDEYDEDEPPDSDDSECEGHPAGPFDPMGETAVYCDGSCND